MDKWITAGEMAVTHLTTAPTTTTVASSGPVSPVLHLDPIEQQQPRVALSPPMMKWARFR